MPRFNIRPVDRATVRIDGHDRPIITKTAFERFDISVLGLGEVSAESEPTDAIAAVFDLAGFTNFCKQIEPHLAVPHYLNAFLAWLMARLREEMLQAELKEGMRLWCPLPFFIKFLGDGVLVLWNSTEMNDAARRNVIITLRRICVQYGKDFLPTLKQRIVEPPSRLRCGVARGTVFSVGEGNDYVGSCINMASRIQKLPGISFGFNRRGFELEAETAHKFFREDIVVKQVSIRGICEHELVCILSKEADALPPKDRKLYKDPAL
jgi:class 3 adenylate cyclase